MTSFHSNTVLAAQWPPRPRSYAYCAEVPSFHYPHVCSTLSVCVLIQRQRLHVNRLCSPLPVLLFTFSNTKMPDINASGKSFSAGRTNPSLICSSLVWPYSSICVFFTIHSSRLPGWCNARRAQRAQHRSHLSHTRSSLQQRREHVRSLHFTRESDHWYQFLFQSYATVGKTGRLPSTSLMISSRTYSTAHTPSRSSLAPTRSGMRCDAHLSTTSTLYLAIGTDGLQ